MKRIVKNSTAVAGAVGLWWLLKDIPLAMGNKPSAQAMRRSPRFGDDRRFHNDIPRHVVEPGTTSKVLWEMLFGHEPRRPVKAIPLAHEDVHMASSPLRVTWFGHSSSLVEIDGARIVIDPVWGERCSPSRLVGPRRLHQPPRKLEDLPRLDAIVISHDHYDHLDLPAIRTLTRTQDAPFVVPLGVGAHLRRWRVPAHRIIELDWEESVTVSGIELVATAAQHFSGRGFTNDHTLWASWAIKGPKHRVFYTGDSGYFPGYKEIGDRHGPFDAALVQIGAYDAKWPDIHMTPEEGVAAHRDVRAGLMIPVHWGTFVLGLHSWADPIERALKEAAAQGVSIATPKPGESILVGQPAAVDTWWRALT